MTQANVLKRQDQAIRRFAQSKKREWKWLMIWIWFIKRESIVNKKNKRRKNWKSDTVRSRDGNTNNYWAFALCQELLFYMHDCVHCSELLQSLPCVLCLSMGDSDQQWHPRALAIECLYGTVLAWRQEWKARKDRMVTREVWRIPRKDHREPKTLRKLKVGV